VKNTTIKSFHYLNKRYEKISDLLNKRKNPESVNEGIKGDQSIVKVVLGEETTGVEEVVVIGYGTQKKISTISVKHDLSYFISKGINWKDSTFFVRTRVESRPFDPKKYYLWPIVTNELDRNTLMVQNPGW